MSASYPVPLFSPAYAQIQEVERAERTGGSRGLDPPPLTGFHTAAEWATLCDLSLSPYLSMAGR